MVTPAEVNPGGVPALLRGLAEAWETEAEGPLALLADSDLYAGMCLDVALALRGAALDLERRHRVRLG